MLRERQDLKQHLLERLRCAGGLEGNTELHEGAEACRKHCSSSSQPVLRLWGKGTPGCGADQAALPGTGAKGRSEAGRGRCRRDRGTRPGQVIEARSETRAVSLGAGRADL